MLRPALLATVLSLLLPPSAPAAKAAGSIGGEVVVKGRILKLKTRAAKFNPYGGVYKASKAAAELAQETLVYLEGLPAGAAAPEEPVLGQKDRNFTRSIVPVLGGGSVSITNQDTVRHHIRSETKPWDFNLKPRPPGEAASRRFAPSKDGSLGVVPVYCDIHTNMRSHIVVVPNEKWELVPETGGKFLLKGIPAGSYTLTAWHPTLKPQPVKVTVKPGEALKVKLVMQGKED